MQIYNDTDNRSLEDIILLEKSLQLEEFLKIALEVVDEIEEYNKRNVIYGYVNPKNIIIYKNMDKVKLLDFEHIDNDISYNILYMSPEQIGKIGNEVDYRTDFYSFGVTLYRAITGIVPIKGNNEMELTYSLVAKNPIPPHLMNPNIPVVVSKIIMKLLSKDPEDRYKSSYGIRSDLSKCCISLLDKGYIEEFTICENDISDKFKFTNKIYGRDKEIEEIMDKYFRACTGELQVVYLTGSEGMGKTTIIKEIRSRVLKEGGTFVSGKCDKYNTSPYAPLIQSTRELVIKLLMASKERLKKIKKNILEAVGDDGQIIIDVIPEVEYIIGKQPPVESVSHSELENKFNRVFGKFFKSLLCKEYPVVIFWDNLQWADAATINAISMHGFDKENKYLLIIGSFREEKAGRNIYLQSIFNKDVNSVNITNIRLNPLNKKSIKDLVCDTLYCSKERTIELTQLISLRTGGNPLFIKMLLDTLHSEGILKFNHEINQWTWDIDSIKSIGIYNSVLDLIVKKIERLPKETQKTLQMASCIGTEFELGILASIMNKTINEIYSCIMPAIKEGIIVSEINYIKSYYLRHKNSYIYRFAHNQIHKQIYNHINRDKKMQYHYIIGTALQNSKDEERIFQVVSQLNRAFKLLIKNEDVHNLVRLNLIAGKKSKKSAAYEVALKYFRIGYKLLKEDSWTTNYNLAYDISSELAESEYMNGNIQRADRLIKVILEHAKTNVEIARIYNMKIHVDIYFGKYKEAVETGIEGLRLFGVKIPEKIHPLKIFSEAVKVYWNLRGKNIYSIFEKDLIDKRYENQIEIKKLLSNIRTATFLSNKSLFFLTVLKETNIVLKYGSLENRYFTNIGYGIFLSLIGRYKESLEFGLMDLEACKNNKHALSNSLMGFSNFILPWVDKFETVLEYLKKAYNTCIESGEIILSIYTASNIVAISYIKGEELEKLHEGIIKYIKITNKSRNQIGRQIFRFKNVIEDLMGETCHVMNYKPYNNTLINDKEVLNGSYTYAILLNYIHGNYYEATRYIYLGDKEAKLLSGTLVQVFYYFYAALSIAAVIDKDNFENKKYYIKKLKEYNNIIRKWAQTCPSNYLSYHLIVQAETYRVDSMYDKAEVFYDKAIKVSVENQLLHNAALANELAGEYYKSKGSKNLYKSYIISSYDFYKKWGAIMKLRQLEEKYEEVFQKLDDKWSFVYHENREYDEKESISYELGIKSSYDMMAAIRASQAISSEIVLENLLKKLMKILIENTGAIWGCLILNKNEELLVHIEGSVDKINSLFSKPVSMDKYHMVPRHVVNYVASTKQSVVLKNAYNEEMFAHDSYISRNKVKSLLCAPIIKKGELIGIIYLDNRLASRVFSEEKLTIVNLLALQGAISIQNAYMYEKINELNKGLEKTVEERTKSLNESIKYEEMRTEFFANLSHELRTPLNVIFGGHQMMEVLLKENLPLKSGDKIQKYMGIIKQNCYRLVRLINNLIDITKIDSGYFQVDLVNADIVNVVESITLSVAEYIESKGIELIFDTFVEEKIIACDPDKIERIILNLLSNSIKFTNKGGHIKVTMYEKEDNIVISVKDDGIGIPEEKRQAIFERFNQVDKSLSRNREGSGIGLSIVKALVEMHSGTISVNSSLGNGSEFLIELPCRISDKDIIDTSNFDKKDSNNIERIMIEFSDIYS
jgi:predicted ATPase/signal transduction histidine kinase